MVKEALAAVLTGFQSLACDDARERPVDRLAALGAIQIARCRNEQRTGFLCSLGVDLIAFKYAHRADLLADAQDKLAIGLSWNRSLRIKPAARDRVSYWAIQEWAIDICPSCLGAKMIRDHSVQGLEGVQPMCECLICHGTGKRRYSDEERLEALGLDLNRALYEAHGLISRATGLADQMAQKQLGRD